MNQAAAISKSAFYLGGVSFNTASAFQSTAFN